MASLQTNPNDFNFSTIHGNFRGSTSLSVTINNNVNVLIVYGLDLSQSNIFTRWRLFLFGKLLSSSGTELYSTTTLEAFTNDDPVTQSLTLSPSDLENMGYRGYIGQPLYIFFYSSQELTSTFFSQSLPYEFLYPGGSLNSYGGIQNKVTFTIEPCSQPYNLSATSYQNGYVPLSWSPPIDNAGSPITSYIIKYSTSDSSGPWVGSVNVGLTTSYNYGGLTNGTMYWFYVAAVNGYCGNGGPESGPRVVTDSPAIPAAPPSQISNVQTSTGPNIGEISVSWNQPNNGGLSITSYTLQYKINGTQNWTSITGITSLNWTITGLANATTYDVQVAAVNSLGQGPYSVITSATTFGPPSQVTGVTTTSGPGAGSISVSWTQPNNGGLSITSYTLQYKINGTQNWITIPGIGSTNYTITGLANATTYDVQVAAVNAAGQGPYSAITSATTFGTPSQVTGVTTTSGPGAGSISVSWTQPNNGGSSITSYTLQYRVSGSVNWTSVTGITSLNYTITGLANATTYDVQVAAVNVVGQGPYSAITIGTTFGLPSVPTNLNGTHGNAQVSLTWTAPTNNGGTPITGYLVERSTNPSGPWTPNNTGSTSTPYVVTGLTNGTLYYFRVSAINIVGTGPSSSLISVTPSTIPGPAIITSSVSCDNQQVLVTWGQPSDTGGAPILSYNLQYSTSATGPFSVTASTTSYTFTGLTNGIQYYFQVQAVNMNGAGPYSSQTASSTAIPSITPQPPIPITTTSITSSSIALSWTAPTNTGGNPVTGYLIYWSKVSPTGTIIPPINSYTISSTPPTPPATTYTITGLTHATLYAVQISSISCSGVGPISTPALYVTTSSVPPSAPTNVATSGCNTGYTNSIILTWNAPVDNGGSPIINYIIYYRTSSVGTWYTYNTNSNGTTAVVPLPTPSISYDFKVAAQNIVGVSVFSSPIISSSSYNPPTAPTNLVSTNLVSNTSSNGSIVLTWTPSTQELPQTISYYVIQYKVCEYGGWITYPITIPYPSNSTTLTNLGSPSNIANNLPYLFRVYAVNSCGARSDFTNTTSAVSYNNSEPTRLWSRFNINCAGNVTSFDTLTRNMLRKGQILQYPGVGNLQYSKATLWSMAAKNQLSRKKAWASQSEEYTYPNTTNINNQPGVGLRQTPTSLVCWTPPPTLICNPASSSGVPGNNTTLCFSKNAPFDNFKKPITYASGGTKWPVFYSK